MTDLVVPKGTKSADLMQVSIQKVDNGYVLSKVLLLNEAGRPPYTVQKTLIMESLDKALEDIRAT